MCVTAKLGLKQDLEMKKEHHKLGLPSEFMAIFGLNPLVKIQGKSDLSIHLLLEFSVSDTPNDTPT